MEQEIQELQETLTTVCNAVLLFYHVGTWGKEQRRLWTQYTGTEEATTTNLCNRVRKALEIVAK